MIPEHDQVPIAQAIQNGVAHHQAGRIVQAEEIYRQVLDRDPANPDALHLLGVIAGQLGKPDVAIQFILRAVGIQPGNAAFRNNLANALKDGGRHVDAEQCYREALALDPTYADAHANLAMLLQTMGRPHEAEQSLRNALAIRPDFPEAQCNLGSTLLKLGRADEAERCFRQALVGRLDYVEAHVNLGQALRALGRLTEAEQSIRNALALNPNLAKAHNYLANVLRSLGRLQEAELSYRHALALEPDDAETHSNLVFLLNYIPGRRPAQIFHEHRKFAQRFCNPDSLEAHRNSPEPGRRLRVGYVSADLRDHAVAFFFEPVLASHHRQEFEVFCYYNYARSDAVTERLRSLAGHWRDVAAYNDETLARLIRSDAIDILVDLSGHTGHSRLTVFGRKPAPVQATWLGYLNTTGLQTMDYRITDAHANPRGPLDAFHTEKLVRLPGSQWCYRAPAGSPDVALAPCVSSNAVTFASFTNPAKLGEPNIKLWSRLLALVPNSRLLVAGATLTSIPDEFVERFTRQGIAPDRLRVIGAKPFPDYLAMHKDVDIILDTHPYSGGTTTCHALWMGVPVVTLAGETATSRGGASLLHALGLKELIAETPKQYLDIAVALASDPKRLARTRAGMRKRMAESVLMDEARFTHNLEKAYRAMWRNWCDGQRR
jgi:predicted O-linked N-acetylglucosamine transferase (SPINDLY family)